MRVHKCAVFFGLFLALIVPSLGDDAPAATPSPVPAGSNALSLASDTGVGSDGTLKDGDSYQVRIGELYSPGGEAYVMAIEIVPLPAGQQFKAVHLKMQLVGVNNEAGLGDADIYGLGVRADSKALPADYHEGPSPDPKAELLQAKFITPTSKPRTDPDTGPFIETSADADKAIAKYLNDIYAKPENQKKFVFLRISYDVTPIPTGNNAYMVLTSRAGGPNEQPVISYTTEPATK